MQEQPATPTSPRRTGSCVGAALTLGAAAAVATAAWWPAPPADQEGELNARYVSESTVVSRFGDQTHENTFRTTYRVKGARQRIERQGGTAYTLVQCDLERLVTVDPARGYCCSQPLRGGGAVAAPAATSLAGAGGEVHIEAAFRETGERRVLAGLRTHRVEYRRAYRADSTACGYRPGSFESKGEAWIADDAPAALRPFYCPILVERSFEIGWRTNREAPGGCTCTVGIAGEAGETLDVTETPDEVRILLSADVLFDFDSDALREEARDALGEVTRLLDDYPGAAITVEGHTDAVGSDAYNQRLSERRAASVRRWLVDVAGIHGDLISTRGRGESRPVAPNTKPDGSDDPAGRQKNRRVEITIRKAGG